jgi:ATP-dependent RNA helicase DDX27
MSKVAEYTKKVIVFFKTKKQCHRMAIMLGLLGIPACELHGNLSQTQRITAFNDFK